MLSFLRAPPWIGSRKLAPLERAGAIQKLRIHGVDHSPAITVLAQDEFHELIARREEGKPDTRRPAHARYVPDRLEGQRGEACGALFALNLESEDPMHPSLRHVQSAVGRVDETGWKSEVLGQAASRPRQARTDR